MRDVYVVGVARTDFKRNLRKEGKALADVIVEAGRGALADAGVAAADVGAGIVGNFAAGLFAGQLHLGALLLDIDPALVGIPTAHVEAACASGGLAVATAARGIAAGLHDVVLVVGAEQQKTMAPADGAEVLATAADKAAERPAYGDHMMPRMFASIADRYAARHGLADRTLALVAAKNHAHAALNPLAQTRGGGMSLERALAADDSNPRFAPPLKVSDCSQISDGAAALVLAAAPLAGRPAIRLRGLGQATDRLRLADKEVPEFPVARRAAEQAFRMAGIGPREIDCAEVHDCFSITEIVTYELLGWAEPGGATRLVETGATMLPQVRRELVGTAAPPWSLPVNTGGGLIGDGHPVGATGVRQVAEIFDQLVGRAGARQVEGARRALSFNLGGTFTTSVAMVWERAGK